MKRRKAECLIKALCFFVLGIDRDRPGRNRPVGSMAHMPGELQRIDQQQFTYTLALILKIAREPADEGRADAPVVRKAELPDQRLRKILDQDRVGGDGVIACNPPAVARGHENVSDGKILADVLIGLLL